MKRKKPPFEYPRIAPRPVLRSDGKLYIDLDDAALDMVEENRTMRCDSAACSIRQVCDGSRGRKTAYGYSWEWLR